MATRGKTGEPVVRIEGSVETTTGRPTSGRGRPSADRAAAISQAILSAATELFLANGFEGTTMEAIAARAGVRKSTLYKRGIDKMALMRAVVEDRVASWSAIASMGNARLPTDLEARLKSHAVTVLTSAAADEVRALSRVATGSWDGAEEIAGLLHEVGYQRMVTYLEGEIRQFGTAGSTPVRDPRAVASALLALISGWLSTRPPGTETSRAEGIAFAHRAVELLVHGRACW